MNFEHPQKAGNTPGTNVGAATSPIALSERSTAAAARLLTLVTSAELQTANTRTTVSSSSGRWRAAVARAACYSLAGGSSYVPVYFARS